MKRRMPFTGKSVELWSFHTVGAAALIVKETFVWETIAISSLLYRERILEFMCMGNYNLQIKCSYRGIGII